MLKRIATIVSFVLLAAYAAVCQDARQSLPDAPSVKAATQEPDLHGYIEGAGSPVKVGAMGGITGAIRQGGFTALDWAAFSQKDPNTIFAKYLYPSSTNRQSAYRSLRSASVMGRATYAASSPLIMRDVSGRAKLNTSYLLRTLTSVAKDTASTPYWRRSLGAPFGDFGSTVGSDAGMNLWHEFGPSIEQLMKSHALKFVSRIEERINYH
jgi:hypothetical protein